jgi:hypothetical protein
MNPWFGNNGHSPEGWQTQWQPTASLYGALPYGRPPSPPASAIFYITAFKPTILNSKVLGPQQRKLYDIITDSRDSDYTVLRKEDDGQNVALVEWRRNPLVEVRGAFSKRRVSEWLPLSADQRFVFLAFLCH